MDLVVTDYGSNAVSVLQGKGDGTFAPPLVFGRSDRPYGLAIRDFNGNGKPDIVAACGLFAGDVDFSGLLALLTNTTP